MQRKSTKFWLIGGAIISAALLISAYSKYTEFYPSTDDAYIQANVVNIAPQITGPVQAIYVVDHALVKKNQLLFTIDPRPFQAAFNQAEANVAQIKAQLDTQMKNTSRVLPLVAHGQLSKAEGDNAQGKLDELQAALKVAKAELVTAQLNLQDTQIYSPNTGYLTNFILRKGQMIQAGAPQFALVENNQWWVNANFKETDLGRIKTGQPAKITIDIYPDGKFKGIVQGVSRGSGAVFSLLPPENATGNWVKVTQRFPVRIDFVNPDPQYPLRMGASCEVTIKTL